MATLVLLVTACPDGTTNVTTGGSSDGGDTSDGGSEDASATVADSSGSGESGSATMGSSSGVDSSGGDASSGGAESSSGAAESSSGGAESSGGGSSSGGGAVCGDGVADPGEACDGRDLGGEDCVTQGFGGGTLTCLDDCTDFDTSACTTPRQCGNDIAEGNEVCDGTDLSQQDCITQGFLAGTLACAADCGSFDTSACTAGTGSCCTQHDAIGCDDATCQASVCMADPFCCDTQWDNICAGEALADPNCAMACANVVCGNDLIDGTEVCDGTDLGGQDCLSQGFSGGTLACAADCTGFDTSACTVDEGCCVAHPTPGCTDAACETSVCAADSFCCDNQWDNICAGEAAADPNCAAACGVVACGDNVVGGTEVCDGTDLAGQDCISQGFAAGTLACAADCTGFDTSACTNSAESCCSAHAGSGCNDATCQNSVCGIDAFCCDNTWDGVCANEALADPACTAACTVCGDGLVVGSEACDGANLNGQTCASQGFVAGTLACAGDCGSFDTSSCSNVGGDCCSAHAAPGCDDATCTASVCAGDPFCCNNEWDAICAGEAIADPACAAVCGPANVCGDNVAAGGEVCDGTDLVGATCVSQGFTGGTLACNGTCTAYDTTGCNNLAACADQDIGSSLGNAVASGNTAADDNDLNPSCGAGDAQDHVVQFTAPAAAQYTFSTNGSTYDTVMSLFSDCATELACDDDNGIGTQSLLVRNMAAGEVVLIVVDGFGGGAGNWVLNISSP
ncbi:MAG: hypothetical protein K1X88_20605 [Nannocystaceae bacterium]|nr:hypothetical protein [Nannocystaceae bacterium]